MAKIILSEVALNGVKGARKVRQKKSEKRERIMRETDERIKEDHYHSIRVYHDASKHLGVY